MKLVVVDDAERRAAGLATELQGEGIEVTGLRSYFCEYDFMQSLDSLEINPPDMFVIDMMFPWYTPIPGNPECTPPPMPANRVHRHAGKRCIEAILARPKISHLPIFLCSALPSDEIRGLFQPPPDNLSVFGSSEADGLVEAIKGLWRASGNIEDHRWKTKVFVVHGHDEGAKESVARLIEKLGGEAIILHEKSSGGRTIIEKLEAYSGVTFAVILLTGDDVGGKNATSLSPRARQNVILELGYFIGKLGRGNICALAKDGVEIPSDFSGIVYTQMDAAGGWKYELVRELRAAGLPLRYKDL